MIHDVLAKLILVRIELHELFSFDILAINGIDVRHITAVRKSASSCNCVTLQSDVT